jgi:hypothetical protein
LILDGSKEFCLLSVDLVRNMLKSPPLRATPSAWPRPPLWLLSTLRLLPLRGSARCPPLPPFLPPLSMPITATPLPRDTCRLNALCACGGLRSLRRLSGPLIADCLTS